MARNTLSRSLHDVGLAAWFGGTLANAIALNPAAAEADEKDAGRVVNAGWNRWTPVNAVAIGAHLLGSVGQLSGNRERLAAQPGVKAMSSVKTVVTVAALGATAYARALGKVVDAAGAPRVKGGTTPSKHTPAEVVEAQGKLDLMQWVIPALTGTLVVISSFAGEQQRGSEIEPGIARRL
ncbi:hypothetical protein SAMN06264364_106106 [Quadrisphaera granulorum]|uniref:ABC-type Mn/Zn transport systems, ATPase component n=1 Tax=Quadrisphaera granulorum TaxID=317664 RepID=A0A316AAF6_9ACTN|nr:hypothetical protein [Quadrisphaera granulorum]PWJ54663.1 hypothetical protein BXY45_106106 [Quadrisphaera granulorum]SZE96025.1 hypothetical protein SAMN06264364_106106 [Quadrisphaera granulorum]